MERDIKPTYDELESYVENLQKQLADAQATIAALQDTIMQMGGQAAVLAKDAMAAKEQVAALQERVRTATQLIIAEIGASGPEDLEEAIGRIVARLTQRTAERDTARRRVDELEAREVDVVLLREDLERRTAELEAAKRQIGEEQKRLLVVCDQRNDARAELERVRALIKALPKVEGAVVVSNGYVKDSTRCHALFGADEDAALYAALLQHRQGMEG